MRIERRSALVALIVVAVLGLAVATLVLSSVKRGEQQTARDGLAKQGPLLTSNLPPLRLPEGSDRVVFFGDDWTEGVGATPRSMGFAYSVGQSLRQPFSVYGAGDTGFSAGRDSRSGNFAQRASRLRFDPTVRLLVIQGGRADLPYRPGFGDDMSAALSNLRTKYPKAEFVIIGVPATSLETNGLTRMLSTQAYLAAKTRSYFVSPIADRWITPSNISSFMSADQNHPSTAGHAEIASQLEANLKTFAKIGQEIR